MPDGCSQASFPTQPIPRQPQVCSGISLSLDFHIILLVPAFATTLLLCFPLLKNSPLRHHSFGKLPLKVNPLGCFAASPGLHRWSTSINCTICAFSPFFSTALPHGYGGSDQISLASCSGVLCETNQNPAIPLDFNFP